MIRNPPVKGDVYDEKMLAEIKPEPWMLDLLELNPKYTLWGPHEDYMIGARPDPSGFTSWRDPILVHGWSHFREKWCLDEYNECVNFYFEISRDECPCPDCSPSYLPGCETCDGDGTVYRDDSPAYVNLVLWWLHPRKGASRGIEIKPITQANLPSVFGFLKRAAERNASRFEKVVDRARSRT